MLTDLEALADGYLYGTSHAEDGKY